MRFTVVAQHTAWTMGGIASFLSNLVRGLIGRGIPAHVLVTEERQNTKKIDLPSDFEVLLAPWRGERSIATRWRALIEYLESLGPCVYLTNYDYMYSCVTPKLSNRVVVVDNMHSDIELCFEYFGRLGPYSNMTIAASEHMRRKAAARYPHLAHRLCVIPYGVDIPHARPVKQRDGDTPIRLLYTGRLDQLEKRVLDLPLIADALLQRGIPVALDITGRGGDEGALRAASQHLVDRGVVRFHGFVSEEQLLRLYEESDVIMLPSAIEGNRCHSSKGWGGAVSRLRPTSPSGVPELVTDGYNGYLIPVGSIDTFADRLEGLCRASRDAESSRDERF
jgi:glycosyltransferase involved in cell wall biosynthesis